MKLALFYSDTRPTLFEKAAEKSGFEVQNFHCKEIKSATSFALDDFSVVLVRNCWGYEKEVALLGSACKQKKIPLIDSALYQPFFDSKVEATRRLASHGMPFPQTFFINSEKDTAQLFDAIRFPLVAKRNEEGRDHDVHLLKTKDECMHFIDEKKLFASPERAPQYHFQEFIPAAKEFRVLVIGEKALGAISVTPFFHNGNSNKIKRAVSLTEEMKNLAQAAARILQFEFAGIDFLQHQETGKLFFLEINRCPHHKDFAQATGIDVLSKLMQFCRSLVS